MLDQPSPSGTTATIDAVSAQEEVGIPEHQDDEPQAAQAQQQGQSPIARKILSRLPKEIHEAALMTYDGAFPRATDHFLDVEKILKHVPLRECQGIEEFESSENYRRSWISFSEGLSETSMLQVGQQRLRRFYESSGFHINQWFNPKYIPHHGLARGDILQGMASLGSALDALYQVGAIQMRWIFFFLWRVSIKFEELKAANKACPLPALLRKIHSSTGGVYQDEVLVALFEEGKKLQQSFVDGLVLVDTEPPAKKRRVSEIEEDDSDDSDEDTIQVHGSDEGENEEDKSSEDENEDDQSDEYMSEAHETCGSDEDEESSEYDEAEEEKEELQRVMEKAEDTIEFDPDYTEKPKRKTRESEAAPSRRVTRRKLH